MRQFIPERYVGWLLPLIDIICLLMFVWKVRGRYQLFCVVLCTTAEHRHKHTHTHMNSSYRCTIGTAALGLVLVFNFLSRVTFSLFCGQFFVLFCVRFSLVVLERKTRIVHVIIGVTSCGALRNVPPSTSSCLIFQVTSEPHILCHSTPCSCLSI